MAGDPYILASTSGLIQKVSVQSTAGAGDAGKLPALNSSGLLDVQLLGTGQTPSFAGVIVTGSSIPVNGIYRPAANCVGIATDSTERLRIDSSGNVGIGDTSPKSKLDVNGNLGLGYGTALLFNLYYDTGFKYKSTNPGIAIYQSGQELRFVSCPSGTVDTAASPVDVLRIDSSGNILQQTAGTTYQADKFRMTAEGGYAIKLVAGENLSAGEIVYVKQTSGADGKVWKAPTSSDMPIGVVYASASADAYVWVVVSGIAYVLPESGVTATRGYVMITSTSEAGRAAQSATAPSAVDHFRECGHFLDTGSGNGALTRAVLHFN